jgi:hypothetical protein
MLHKKEYKIIAEAIANANNEAKRSNTDNFILYHLVGYLSSAFVRDNPLFNEGKFLFACGLDYKKNE